MTATRSHGNSVTYCVLNISDKIEEAGPNKHQLRPLRQFLSASGQDRGNAGVRESDSVLTNKRSIRSPLRLEQIIA